MRYAVYEVRRVKNRLGFIEAKTDDEALKQAQFLNSNPQEVTVVHDELQELEYVPEPDES